MNFHFLARVFFLFLSITVFAQDDVYSAYTIPEELTKNANAVVRNSNIEIELHSYSSMTIKSKKVITILNKNGLNHLDTYLHYDPERKVKSIRVNIFNALGEETEKFKRKDFSDFSASGSDLYSDNRILVLNYTPKKYPFTAVFEYEMNTTSTAFIPRWYPIENYFISTEHSSFTIASSSDVALDVKESLLDKFSIETYSSDGLLKYQAENLPALKWEAMAPTFSKVVPNVMVSLQRFRLVNVDGVAKNWEEFGKWNYHNLIKGRGEISEKTTEEI